MQVLNIFHVLIAIALVVFVLIQKGQGATAGAAFGSGASGTVFGARGAGNFLTRSTWVLAALFCAISLTMAVVVSRMGADTTTDMGVIGNTTEQAAPQVEEVVEPAAEPATDDLPPALNEAMEQAADDADGALRADDLPALDAAPAEDAATGEETTSEDTTGNGS